MNFVTTTLGKLNRGTGSTGRILLLTVALFVLGGLAVAGPPYIWRSEKPYEESTYLLALKTRPMVRWDVETWVEHPPLYFRVLQVWSLLVGTSDLHRLRWLSLICFFGSFLMTIRLISGLGERGSAQRPGLVTAAVFSLSIYASPLVIAQANRLGPGPISLLALNVVLFGVDSWLRRGSLASLLGAGVASFALVSSHCYGPILVTSIALSSLVTGLVLPRHAMPGGARPVGLWLASAILAVPLTLVAFDRDLSPRMDRLLNAYWTRPMSGKFWTEPASNFRPEAPFQSIWEGATSLVFDLPDSELVIHVILIVAILAGIIRRRDVMSFLASFAILSCSAILLLIEVKTKRPTLLLHQADGFFLLIMLVFLSVANTIGPRSRLGCVIGCVMIFGTPLLVASGDRKFSDREVVRSAVRTLVDEAAEDLPVIFAGSRTYILMADDLPESVRARSLVYLRRRVRPDNFAGLILIPEPMRLPEDRWRDFAAPRVVYVRMEASQAVNVDLSSWETEDIHAFPSARNSVGQLSVSLLKRRHPPTLPNRPAGQP